MQDERVEAARYLRGPFEFSDTVLEIVVRVIRARDRRAVRKVRTIFAGIDGDREPFGKLENYRIRGLADLAIESILARPPRGRGRGGMKRKDAPSGIGAQIVARWRAEDWHDRERADLRLADLIDEAIADPPKAPAAPTQRARQGQCCAPDNADGIIWYCILDAEHAGPHRYGYDPEASR